MKKGDGWYLKSLVYGGLDGIITTFAVVAGVAGASLSAGIILILGFANLFADGISMAVGDYLSSKAEIEFNRKPLDNLPKKNALVTFVSFLIFGCIPLLFFVVSYFYPIRHEFAFSIGLTALALIALGSIKSKITKSSLWRSSMETLFIGGLAATAAYVVGYLISQVV